MNQEQKDYFYSKEFVLKGRMFYPELTEPKTSKANPQGAPKYSIMFAWPIDDVAQSARVQEIAHFLAGGKQKFFSQVPDAYFNKPIKTWGQYQRQDGKPVQKFLEGMRWITMSANADFPPIVVDKYKNDVMDKAEIYSGRNVAVNFSFWCYTHSGKTGISTNLKAVMLLDGGDKEASGGGVDVNKAFGDFAADMGLDTNAGGGAEQPPVNNDANSFI